MGLGQVYGSGRRDVTERSWIPRLLASTLDLIVPSLCLCCDRVAEGSSRDVGLCRACFGRLRRWPPHDYRSGRCRPRPPGLDSLTSVWIYESPVDAVIGGLKFRRLDALGPRLGRLVAGIAADDLPPISAVTSVPLHPWRRLTRGYDQAELIACGIAQRLELPMISVLRRHRWTRPQSRLPRARRLLNPRGAFRLARIPPSARRRRAVSTHRWLVVDDVVTTGATLAAAGACLAAAGAPEVHGFAVARSPESPLEAAREGSKPPERPEKAGSC